MARMNLMMAPKIAKRIKTDRRSRIGAPHFGRRRNGRGAERRISTSDPTEGTGRIQHGANVATDRNGA